MINFNITHFPKKITKRYIILKEDVLSLIGRKLWLELKGVFKA